MMDAVNSFVTDPHFKDLLSNFTVPKSVYIALAIFAFVTWLAHGRESDV